MVRRAYVLSRAASALAPTRSREGISPGQQTYCPWPIAAGVPSTCEWSIRRGLSLRDFLRLEGREKIPDHSWLSKTRGRLPHEVHETVFGWVLKLVAEQGLVKGKRIGVDASTMEANAALRTIVRRDDGRTYREMLQQMAKESGIETPTADDLVRIDRVRKGKKLSNEEWTSKTDPEAKIAKLKDGSTHLVYKGL
jgi:transposase